MSGRRSTRRSPARGGCFGRGRIVHQVARGPPCKDSVNHGLSRVSAGTAFRREGREAPMRMHLRNVIVALFALAAAGLLAASARAAAPSNSAPPTISGTLEQGRILTANRGTWTNAPLTYFYRWQRCAPDGTGCGNIDNAVQKTYTLTAADVDHTVRVVVTASNADGQTSANSKTTEVVSSNTVPKNTVRPSISGTAKVGEELTAARGTWTGGVRSYAYQWQSCDVTDEGCGDVSGATGTTYGVR